MMIELGANEVILGRIRMHKVLLFRRMFIGLLVVFFLFSNTLLLFRVGWIGMLIFFVTLAGVLLYLVQAYVVWNHTMLLITSERVLDVYQPSLFKREAHEISIKHIHEARMLPERTWLDTLFGSGTVRVYGTKEHDFDLEFHHLPRPQTIANLIEDARKLGNKHEK